MRVLRAVAQIVFASVIIAKANAFQKEADTVSPELVNEMLHWLPSDTETLTVARGPFQIPSKERKSSAFEKMLELHSVGWFTEKLLDGTLRDSEIEIAMAGRRHFQRCNGLGPMAYEGCHLLQFSETSQSTLEKAMDSCFRRAQEVINIGDLKVASFRKSTEGEVWTLFITHPQKNLLILATDRKYLETVIQGMTNKTQQRALPADLPEWQHVDLKSRFWAVRHFRPEQANGDPTSPLSQQRGYTTLDADAIGFAFCYNAETQIAKVRYLSSAKNAMEIVSSRWHNPPENLDPSILQVQTGVVEVTSKVAEDEVGVMFALVLLLCLGPGVCL